MMRMRGGSTIFAKYCRKGIPSGSSRKGFHLDHFERDKFPHVKTSREASEVMLAIIARRIPYTIEPIVFKAGFFYAGYQLYISRPPYYPKYVSEMEDLFAKQQELKKKKEALLAQKMKISNPLLEIPKNKGHKFEFGSLPEQEEELAATKLSALDNDKKLEEAYNQIAKLVKEREENTKTIQYLKDVNEKQQELQKKKEALLAQKMKISNPV